MQEGQKARTRKGACCQEQQRRGGKQEEANAFLSITCAEVNARRKLLSWKPTQKDGRKQLQGLAEKLKLQVAEEWEWLSLRMLIKVLADLFRWLWLGQIHWVHKGRASGMGKFFIMGYCTPVRMVSLIQLKFYLNLPLSTGISRYMDSFLTPSPLNWSSQYPFQVVSHLTGMVTPIQNLSLDCSQSCVSRFDLPFLVPAFLVSTSPSNFPLWNLFVVLFENTAHFLLIDSVTTYLRENVVASSRGPFKHVEREKKGFTRNVQEFFSDPKCR